LNKAMSERGDRNISYLGLDLIKTESRIKFGKESIRPVIIGNSLARRKLK
jgi:hypothetical protein